MNGRCLSQSVNNSTDIDVFIKDNETYFDIFVSAFAKENSLSSDTVMTLKSTILVKLLFYMSAYELYHSIKVTDLKFYLDKYISADVYMNPKASIHFRNEKIIQGNYDLSLKYKINIVLLKIMKANDIHMSFSIGKFSFGKVIADIQNFTVDEIQNLTVDELCKSLQKNTHGLSLSLIKPTKVSDIEISFISQIENFTVEGICYTKI